MTATEKMNFWCNKNNLILNAVQYKSLLKIMNTYTMNPKKYNIIRLFIKYDLPSWSARFNRLMQSNKVITKYTMLLRYGKQESIARWNNYVNRQSETNTYEYKKVKYGWTRSQFDEYNKSRSVTRDNMIKRHGAAKGAILFDEYRNKQKKSGCSLEYFIENLGELEGPLFYEKLNKSKAHTITSYVVRYGEYVGQEKYIEYLNRRKNYYSLISQEIFDNIKDETSKHIYYATHNGEFNSYCNETKTVFFYDYVDTFRKKCIEFNGDYWHCNPKIYNEDYINPAGRASELWKKDDIKIKHIESCGYKVLVIWELDYMRDKTNIIQQCKDFLYDKD